MSDSYRRAMIMIIVGGACLSLLGIGVRLMEQATSLQIIFYRAVSQAGFFAAVILFNYRRGFLQAYKSLGTKGASAVLLLAGASLCMVLAIHYTTVANAVFIVSLAPLCSALLGWIFLRERVSARTWLAIAIAVIGVTVIFSQDFTSSGSLGMIFAGLMMIFYSSTIVLVRLQQGADMMALCALSGLVLATAIAPFVGSFQISLHDLLICVGLGVVQVGLGLWLITKGAEFVPTAQVSLLALLEVVLSPIWVWLGVGEVPTTMSLLGGGIVIVGVAVQALSAGKSNTHVKHLD